MKRVPGWVFPVCMVAASWAIAIAVGALFVRTCEDGFEQARAYPCSADGRRDDYEGWLAACLGESARSTAECEAFAHRQAYESDECKAGASKR
jgi:hypothetical protein